MFSKIKETECVKFAEGEIDLTSDTWFCVDHGKSIAVGNECPFCVYELVGPENFERWASYNSALPRQ